MPGKHSGFCKKVEYLLSNGHLPQIRQNGELLVRMCQGESHFCSILAKFAGANVSSPGEFGEFSEFLS
jgi:hypothetical protein